jgi:hypothetical protein
MSDSPRRVPTRPTGPPLDGDFIYIEDEHRLSYGAGEELEDIPKMSEVTGGGGGGLLPANNLSDVEDVTESRTNLGLNTAATQPASAFDAAGAADAALTAANAYTDQQIAGVEGGGLPAGDLHVTGKVICPAVFGPHLVSEGDEDTGWGRRSNSVLSAYVDGQEVLRVGPSVRAIGQYDLTGPFNADVSSGFSFEQLILSTSNATTETAGNLIPLNCRIEAIMVRVLTAISGPTSIDIKVSGGNDFVEIGTADPTLSNFAAGSTYVLVPSAFADQFNSTPKKLTITATGGTPTAGEIRLVVFHRRLTPSTA